MHSKVKRDGLEYVRVCVLLVNVGGYLCVSGWTAPMVLWSGEGAWIPNTVNLNVSEGVGVTKMEVVVS